MSMSDTPQSYQIPMVTPARDSAGHVSGPLAQASERGARPLVAAGLREDEEQPAVLMFRLVMQVHSLSAPATPPLRTDCPATG